MDPDGLGIIVCAAAGAAALFCSYAAGAVCSGDAERKPTRLGFEDRLAGLCGCLALACAFFSWGFARLTGGFLWWGVPALAALVCLCLLAGALGLSKGAGEKAFSPMRFAGLLFAAPAKLVFRALHLSAAQDVTEEDLLDLVEDVEEKDLIDESQKKMIANIVELDDVTAGDVMTHRTEVVSVSDEATAEEVVQLAVKEGVSRMPVYHKSIDDIVGIVYVKDLFSIWNDPNKSTRSVKKFMRSAMFVPEACRARELLIEFRAKRTQIAVVVDEYGGTSGVVTMEDVLEEIVGNIQDEFDNEEEELTETPDGVLASGAADLEDVFEMLDLPLPAQSEDDHFESVGGLVIDRLGRIPAAGEAAAVPYGGVLFRVLKAGERRVDKVLCTPIAKKDTIEPDESKEDA